MAQLIRERMQALDKSAHKYLNWEAVLGNAGIKDIQDLSGQLLCKCPFHDDWSPSFRVVLDKNFYHCFSCGDGGSILKLAYKTSGSGLSKVQYYEQFLKANRFLQADLGFDSVFLNVRASAFGSKDGQETLPPARERFNAKGHIGGTVPLTVLAQKVRAQGDTWENLVYTLTMLQQGEQADEILYSVTERTNIAKELASTGKAKKMSLMDLFTLEDADD